MKSSAHRKTGSRSAILPVCGLCCLLLLNGCAWIFGDGKPWYGEQSSTQRADSGQNQPVQPTKDNPTGMRQSSDGRRGEVANNTQYRDYRSSDAAGRDPRENANVPGYRPEIQPIQPQGGQGGQSNQGGITNPYGSPTPPADNIPQHIVRRGDTLYSVAWRAGVDYRQLAVWNNIKPPYLIYPGQRLKLGPQGYQPVAPQSTTASASPGWQTTPAVPQAGQSPATPSGTYHGGSVPPPATSGTSSGGWEVVESPAVNPSVPSAPATAPVVAGAPTAPTASGLPPLPRSPIPRGSTSGPVNNSGATAIPPTPVPATTKPAPIIVASPTPTATVPAATQPVPVKAAPPKPKPEPKLVSLKTRKKDGHNWNWPTQGKVIRSFNPKKGSSALDIANPLGTTVRAASNGTVVYSGGGLKGYGQLLIVKHGSRYLSAYGFNSQILVKQGDEVRAGQAIAKSGEGPSRKPMLRFEVRKNGKPVNPKGLLPSSP